MNNFRFIILTLSVCSASTSAKSNLLHYWQRSWLSIWQEARPLRPVRPLRLFAEIEDEISKNEITELLALLCHWCVRNCNSFLLGLFFSFYSKALKIKMRPHYRLKVWQSISQYDMIEKQRFIAIGRCGQHGHMSSAHLAHNGRLRSEAVRHNWNGL